MAFVNHSPARNKKTTTALPIMDNVDYILAYIILNVTEIVCGNVNM